MQQEDQYFIPINYSKHNQNTFLLFFTSARTAISYWKIHSTLKPWTTLSPSVYLHDICLCILPRCKMCNCAGMCVAWLRLECSVKKGVVSLGGSSFSYLNNTNRGLYEKNLLPHNAILHFNTRPAVIAFKCRLHLIMHHTIRLTSYISACRVMDYQTIGLTDKRTRVKGPIKSVSPMHY